MFPKTTNPTQHPNSLGSSVLFMVEPADKKDEAG